jgi:hypothetical protein
MGDRRRPGSSCLERMQQGRKPQRRLHLFHAEPAVRAGLLRGLIRKVSPGLDQRITEFPGRTKSLRLVLWLSSSVESGDTHRSVGHETLYV